MKDFEVQSIRIHAPFEKTVRYIADPEKLPEWTAAFQAASAGRATMVSPAGPVDVDLTVDVSASAGTIDWTIVFPDRSTARAFSRVTPLDAQSVAYTFVLTAPPAPLEQMEGALERQCAILRKELDRLKTILER